MHTTNVVTDILSHAATLSYSGQLLCLYSVLHKPSLISLPLDASLMAISFLVNMSSKMFGKGNKSS